jgi:hypothetical protein
MLDTEELSLDCVSDLFIVSNDGVMVSSRDSCCEGVDANEQLPCPILSHLTHDDMPSSTMHFFLCWLH